MEKKYCFGIDVGGTTVKCALFEADGNIADKWEITTHVENQGERILPDIAETVLAKIEEKGLDKSRLRESVLAFQALLKKMARLSVR